MAVKMASRVRSMKIRSVSISFGVSTMSMVELKKVVLKNSPLVSS
jgi:hypothetical protein